MPQIELAVIIAVAAVVLAIRQLPRSILLAGAARALIPGLRIAACLRAASLAVALLLPGAAQAERPGLLPSQTLASFAAPEAKQGVAVDERFFYAIGNRSIAKYDKQTGARVATWAGEKDGSIVHLDSGVVVDGKIYAAHSNYPQWPMTSSVEIWDSATLRHVGTHSFGIDRGSLTWLDCRDGVWWGAFANYDRSFDGHPGGDNSRTQIVRFDSDWRVAEAWVLPESLLERFGEMSNSGGSWGPDGRLWITGHDGSEAYALALPEAGSVLRWVGTARLDIAGQGIAWDRYEAGLIWGVVRGEEEGRNRVTASRITLP